MDQNPNENIISEVTNKEYEYGFVTDIETDFVPKGLNEDIIRLISKKKEEPEWLLELRLKAFRHWQTLKQPNWAHLDIPEINYQDIIYYAAPRKRQQKQSLDEVDPELLATLVAAMPAANGEWACTILNRRLTIFARKVGSTSAIPVTYG